MDFIRSIFTSSSKPLPEPKQTPITPSFTNVYKVRWILTQDLGLPFELADMIMDHAEYWPMLLTKRDVHVDVQASRMVTNQMAKLVAILPPLPQKCDGSKTRIRRLIITTRSRDQGWGGEDGCQGTYRGSWSDFWACALRPKDPAQTRSSYHFDLDAQYPFNSMDEAFREIADTDWDVVKAGDRRTWRVQSNVTASREYKTHVITWWPAALELETDGRGSGEGFLDALMPGDRVGIWARAVFPGWANQVEHVSVELAFAI